MTDRFATAAALARARAAAHAARAAAEARDAMARAVQLYPRDGDGPDMMRHWQALVERGMFGNRKSENDSLAVAAFRKGLLSDRNRGSI